MKRIILILFIFLTLSCPLYARDKELVAEALFEFGKIYYKRGDYSSAIIEFKKCLSVEPDHKQAKTYLNLITASEKRVINPSLDKTEKQLRDKEIIPFVSRGAWILEKEQLYCEIYIKYYWYNSKFNDKGKKEKWANNAGYKEKNTELKLEYGLTDRLTFLSYIPYKVGCWKDNYGKLTNRSIADIWTGIKYNLFTQPFISSLQLRIKIPGGYDEDDSPKFGTGKIDGEIRLLMAESLSPIMPFYIKTELGFKGRKGNPTNEIPYLFEFGYNIFDWLTFKTELDGIEGVSEINEDYTIWRSGLIFKKKNFYFQLIYGEAIAGKNTNASQEIGLTIVTYF